jgi:hypothetical protein
LSASSQGKQFLLGIQRGAELRILEYAPVAKHEDAIRVFGNVLIVSDQDDRSALAIQFLEDGDDLEAAPAVEVAGGFIRENQRGTCDECARYGDPLLLASGKLTWAVVNPIPETDRLKR